MKNAQESEDDLALQEDVGLDVDTFFHVLHRRMREHVAAAHREKQQLESESYPAFEGSRGSVSQTEPMKTAKRSFQVASTEMYAPAAGASSQNSKCVALIGTREKQHDEDMCKKSLANETNSNPAADYLLMQPVSYLQEEETTVQARKARQELGCEKSCEMSNGDLEMVRLMREARKNHAEAEEIMEECGPSGKLLALINTSLVLSEANDKMFLHI